MFKIINTFLMILQYIGIGIILGIIIDIIVNELVDTFSDWK